METGNHGQYIDVEFMRERLCILSERSVGQHQGDWKNIHMYPVEIEYLKYACIYHLLCFPAVTIFFFNHLPVSGSFEYKDSVSIINSCLRG